MNISRGAGFEGGHLEDKGLSPTGQVVSVPTHRHDVQLDFVRYEFVTAFELRDNWDLRVRIPYDVKERTAKVEQIDPATPSEVADMQRNLNLHHPTSTLRGFSDFSLLLATRRSELFLDQDTFALSFGSSVPVGKTEENPFTLGDQGLSHEHIQFGTGTFDPLLELYYLTPLSERFDLSVSALGKFPLYENSRGYQGPIEVSSGLLAAFNASENLRFRVGWSFYYQSFAYWGGVADINSGLISNGAVGGVSYKLSPHSSAGLDVRIPISQKTLSDDGDTFEQGIVVQLGVSYSI